MNTETEETKMNTETISNEDEHRNRSDEAVASKMNIETVVI